MPIFGLVDDVLLINVEVNAEIKSQIRNHRPKGHNSSGVDSERNFFVWGGGGGREEINSHN